MLLFHFRDLEKVKLLLPVRAHIRICQWLGLIRGNSLKEAKGLGGGVMEVFYTFIVMAVT